MTARSYESRAVRLVELTDLLYKNWGTGLTTAQAARKLGLKRSTHVREMLHELTQTGAAHMVVRPYRRNVDQQVFYHWSAAAAAGEETRERDAS